MAKMQNNIELKNKTTIRLGGAAPYYLCVKTENDLLDFAEHRHNYPLPFKILGGGSNLIIADSSICKELPFGVLDMDIAEEAVIRPFTDFDGNIPPLAQNCLKNGHKDFVSVTVGAGFKIPKLLQICRENGFAGLEGLIGIPCRVGGTCAMNAGAYQTEIADVLYRVKIFCHDYGILSLDRCDMHFAYRHCAFGRQGKILENPLILEAQFVFPKTDPKKVGGCMQQNLQTKKNTQPVQAFTAGCTFKNPLGKDGKKISAGLLLDKAGLKNFSVNGMRFSPVHAAFMENTGNGTVKDALELLETAKEKVRQMFGIELQEEVKIWI